MLYLAEEVFDGWSILIDPLFAIGSNIFLRTRFIFLASTSYDVFGVFDFFGGCCLSLIRLILFLGRAGKDAIEAQERGGFGLLVQVFGLVSFDRGILAARLLEDRRRHFG